MCSMKSYLCANVKRYQLSCLSWSGNKSLATVRGIFYRYANDLTKEKLLMYIFLQSIQFSISSIAMTSTSTLPLYPSLPQPLPIHYAADSFHFRNSCYSRKIFYFSKFITDKIPGKVNIATYMIFPDIPQRKRQSQPVHRIGTQRYQNQRTLCYKSPNGAKRR